MTRLSYREFISLHRSMNSWTRSAQIDNLIIELSMENYKTEQMIEKCAKYNFDAGFLASNIDYTNKKIETLYKIQQENVNV